MSFALEHLGDPSPGPQVVVESEPADIQTQTVEMDHIQEAIALGSQFRLPKGTLEALLIATALHTLPEEEQRIPEGLTAKRRQQVARLLSGTLGLQMHKPTRLNTDECIPSPTTVITPNCGFLRSLLVPIAPVQTTPPTQKRKRRHR